MANTELQEAIEDAAVEITKDLPADQRVTKDGQEVVSKEEETEETEEQSTSEEDEMSDDEIKESRRLYKALKDPSQGPAVAAALAQRFGILQNLQNRPLETKTQQAAAKKDVLTIFKEELGENYAFLAPVLGKAVEKALDTVREENKAEVAQLQAKNLETEVNGVLSKLAKETNNDSRKLETRMSELMDEYPIGKSGNVEKYIRDMYTMASSGKMKANAQKSTADKVRQNANNVSDRLHRSSNAPSLDTLPGGKMTLKQSVEWAAKQLQNRGK